MKDKNLEIAVKLAEKVSDAGGKAYYVGGFVRDRLMGLENKDIDIEIHGITPDALSAILDTLGEQTVMGASFGVFGLKHYDLDIAMPRREKATGRGHKDFTVFVDPFIGTEKAAMRRDFTINAMMQDVLTGETADHFGGIEDLKHGIIRHVCGETFTEDPLRVLRAAQFAARFGFTIAPETISLCRTMDLTALAKERVMGELEKALLKAAKPSVFFESMREMEQLDPWFSPLSQMIGLQQDPVFHPEGDVWTHTMRVLDEAAALRDDAKEKTAYMLAALTHDLGKIVTTEFVKGRFHAYLHEIKGLPVAEEFLNRITNETKLRKYVLNMMELHMRPNMLVGRDSSVKSYMRTFDASVCPEDLILVAKADNLGSCGGDYTRNEEKLTEMLAEYRRRVAQPCVMGSDLIKAGFKPCPAFKEALEFSHKLQLAGISKDDALRQTTACLRKLLSEVKQ